MSGVAPTDEPVPKVPVGDLLRAFFGGIASVFRRSPMAMLSAHVFAWALVRGSTALGDAMDSGTGFEPSAWVFYVDGLIYLTVQFTAAAGIGLLFAFLCALEARVHWGDPTPVRSSLALMARFSGRLLFVTTLLVVLGMLGCSFFCLPGIFIIVTNVMAVPTILEEGLTFSASRRRTDELLRGNVVAVATVIGGYASMVAVGLLTMEFTMGHDPFGHFAFWLGFVATLVLLPAPGVAAVYRRLVAAHTKTGTELANVFA